MNTNQKNEEIYHSDIENDPVSEIVQKEPPQQNISEIRNFTVQEIGNFLKSKRSLIYPFKVSSFFKRLFFSPDDMCTLTFLRDVLQGNKKLFLTFLIAGIPDIPKCERSTARSFGLTLKTIRLSRSIFPKS